MVAIKLYFGLIFLGVTAFISSFVCNQATVDSASTPPEQVYTVESSGDIAEEFIKESPTYTFDGIDGTLELKNTEALRCESCWKFEFEFRSENAGYGNRVGKAVTEAITPHTANITVVRGEVTRAVLDGWWDMIAQEKI